MPPLTPADPADGDHSTRKLRIGQVVLHQVNCDPGALFVALERGVTKYKDPWWRQYFYAPG